MKTPFEYREDLGVQLVLWLGASQLSSMNETMFAIAPQRVNLVTPTEIDHMISFF